MGSLETRQVCPATILERKVNKLGAEQGGKCTHVEVSQTFQTMPTKPAST